MEQSPIPTLLPPLALSVESVNRCADTASYFVWAVKTLGRHFQREVVVEPGQRLVRRGPYRWVRHPAYAGNLLALFGFGVALGSWVGAIIGTAIILAAHIPRIVVAERVLSTAFPETYNTDTADARIIPGVW